VTDRLRPFTVVLTSQQDVIPKEGYFKSVLLPANLYTECPTSQGHNFGRVFLMLKYTDVTQNTYIQS